MSRCKRSFHCRDRGLYIADAELPDGTVKVLVEGLQRARISALSDNGEHFSAKAEYLESPTIDEREQEVLVRTAISQFEGYIKLNKKSHQKC